MAGGRAWNGEHHARAIEQHTQAIDLVQPGGLWILNGQLISTGQREQMVLDSIPFIDQQSQIHIPESTTGVVRKKIVQIDDVLGDAEQMWIQVGRYEQPQSGPVFS